MNMKLKSFLFSVTLLAVGAVGLSAQTFSILKSFTSSDGSGPNIAPEADLVLNGSVIYGTTYGGGSWNDGTVFKINTDGTGYTVIKYFTGYPSDGAVVNSGLVLSNGIIYGITVQGSGSDHGTIFKVNTDGTGYSLIKSFGAWSYNSSTGNNTNGDGAYPRGPLVLVGNLLYGTTVQGGLAGGGTVFKINTDGTGFTVLKNFSGSEGKQPAGLVLIGNTLYGTAGNGGSGGGGVIFKINTDGTSYMVLKNFLINDGAGPNFCMTLNGGVLFGTTSGGGSGGNGTVFKVNTNGTGYTVLKNFSAYSNGTNADGSWPNGSLALNGNTLYGTTYFGGAGTGGVIFKINTDGSNYQVLSYFTGQPSAAATDAGLVFGGNVLYGTTFSGGSAGKGTIFRLALTNAPTIITPPASQVVLVGSNATFGVEVDGVPTLNYQWQFNGQNIVGATNAMLTLNSVGAGNDGDYSVVVWNVYGSVTSATASLAVLTDGANGNTPVPITATPSWSKPSTVKNLIFVTHGWQPVEANPLGPPAQTWMADMTNAMAQQLGSFSNWEFQTYDWSWKAWTIEPQQALSYAKNAGTQLGQAIAAMGYQQVHLIAHSAGSGMIQAIADQLRAAPNPPLIQLTFLDPYIGIFHQEQNNYGKNADWSDCYFVEDGTGGFTGSYLNHAFNVDVSWVDPTHTTAPYFGFGGGEVALSSHGYPIDFYLGSITGGNSSCSSAFGFALSQEMEGVFWFNNQANYPVGSGPFLPCSPPDAVKNPNPGVAGLESGIAGIPFDISSAAYALSSLGSSLVGNAGFVLNSIWSALPLVKSGGVRPMGGPASTNAPAWLAMGLTVTNAVNFVQFDAGFTDTNAAQGLLTVYWNTNQVGMVDERVAPTNLQTYRFTLPGTVTNGLYTLSFRLDSFANSSTVAVTNVATGFVGVTQPTTLRLSITNRAPLVQLTAATNFTYLIQSSTNLVDWTPAAMLLNTNGTVQFIDSAITNSRTRFYRAVVP